MLVRKQAIDFFGSGIEYKWTGTFPKRYNLQHFEGTTRYGNIDQKIYNRWDTRMYGFTFSYQFGKGKSSQSRKQSGLQDEQNRVGVGQ